MPAVRRLIALTGGVVIVVALSIGGATTAPAAEPAARARHRLDHRLRRRLHRPRRERALLQLDVRHRSRIASFGTGEIETMTNSPSNVYLDGNGHLDITALDTAARGHPAGSRPRAPTSAARLAASWR